MPAIPYPKTMYGPGGQTKIVLSGEQENALGRDWTANKALANPTTEYPKYMYKGKDKVLFQDKAELDAAGPGWFEMVNDAKAAEKAAAVKPKTIITPDAPKT